MKLTLTPGTRVISANGNPGTVVGPMNKDGSLVAIRLDNGRNISCLASKCTIEIDAKQALDSLGAKWSPAFDRPGPLTITARDCVLCGPHMDCRCSEIEFGSPEYMARLDKLHGRK